MRLDRGAVDQDFRGRAARRGERIEDLDPYAFRRPPDEAVVERFLRAIGVGRVDPAAAAGLTGR